MVFLPLFSLFALVSASSVSHEFYKRDATGDSKCTTNMCIAAVVNGSTVQYTLTGTGKRTVGWMGMGFGTSMPNTPMVIMWGNSDGTVTLSQRQASSESMPTLVSSPPRVATLSESLSSANSDTKQPLIFGFGTQNPGSADKSATLLQHVDYGTISLDLTKALTTVTTTSNGVVSTSTSAPVTGDSSSGGATDDIPLTPHQRMIVAHAIFCVVGFALFLPSGVLVARYLRTFTPTWYTGHWIAQFGIAGPTIIVGVVLGFQAAGKIGATIWDDHKKTGVILFALYLTQCALGIFIHYQNYFHAVFGLAVIALGMYQIRTGYNEEWPNYTALEIPKGINTLWLVWCILLPILYAGGLALLPKQYKQEEASRKGWNNQGYDMSSSNLNIRDDRYHDQ
ncbi:hypothetical protein DFH09DRAFT_1176218 [Mycena vulgaris]|nr:hypothetical protein DFH09DRAFT_1176218 [Mycena vulgaris]